MRNGGSPSVRLRGLRVTPEQCLEARKLLRWPRLRLATVSGAAPHVIRYFEESGRVTKFRDPVTDSELMCEIRATLEAAGVEFIDNGMGPGVRLRKAESVTGEQCRAARRLLGWTMTRLAREAGLPQANYISTFELEGRMMMSQSRTSQVNRVAAIRAALERAGIEFVDGDTGPKVQLRATVLSHPSTR